MCPKCPLIGERKRGGGQNGGKNGSTQKYILRNRSIDSLWQCSFLDLGDMKVTIFDVSHKFVLAAKGGHSGVKMGQNVPISLQYEC